MQRPIDWNHPHPRRGTLGGFDRAFGPGATPLEFLVSIIPASLAVLIVITDAPTSWLIWQSLLAGFLVVDGVGGVITNATSSAKRWFHRSGSGPAQHLRFVVAHLLQFAIVAALFPGGSFEWFTIAGIYLVAAALVVIYVPPYLQRPIGAAVWSLGLLVGASWLPVIPGMEWFLPIFFFKLLVSHLVREEPYRPNGE